MPYLLMIAQENNKLTNLGENLERNGFVCSFISYNDDLNESVTRKFPDLLLVEIGGNLSDFGTWGLIQGLRQEKRLPVMALVHRDMLDNISGQLDVDEFLVSPYDVRELVLRINRLIHKIKNKVSNELIRCDGLVIDLVTCEVTVDDRVMELTFKEYELLKLLASNRGRVFNRNTLLDKIWGYDYFGGDRTVDVHIRRLRGKIEVSGHTFIETVRNIGYKFIKDN